MESGLQTLVFMPTYDEAENIIGMIEQILEALPHSHVLIVDDHSPDGTSNLIRKHMEEKNSGQVHLVERKGKLGIGTAHCLSVMYAIDQGYKKLITMDADGSHDPKELPSFEAHLDSYDVVIGSRFMSGGHLDYTGYRRFMSEGGNLTLRTITGLTIHEFTTAFRGFNLEWMKGFPYTEMKGHGYSYFFQNIYWLSRYGARIKECPIHFHDRKGGKSKINSIEIIKAFINILKISLINLFKLNFKVHSEKPSACGQCESTYVVYENDKEECLVCGSSRLSS